MNTWKKINIFNRLTKRMSFDTRHKRMPLFWMMAFVGLVLPWLPGLSMDANQTCTVNSVYDGDTMRVTCNGKRMKVRLHCIDAPEMKQRPWGKESRDYLRSITPEHVIVISKTKDRYGRTVGEVIAVGEVRKNLNLVMVRSGQAVVYPKYCNDRQFYQAEGEAKKTASGVWEKPGTHQRPWEWRR